MIWWSGSTSGVAVGFVASSAVIGSSPVLMSPRTVSVAPPWVLDAKPLLITSGRARPAASPVGVLVSSGFVIASLSVLLSVFESVLLSVFESVLLSVLLSVFVTVFDSVVVLSVFVLLSVVVVVVVFSVFGVVSPPVGGGGVHGLPLASSGWPLSPTSGVSVGLPFSSTDAGAGGVHGLPLASNG